MFQQKPLSSSVIQVHEQSAFTFGETLGHFSTRVKEHLTSDRASHIFEHLQNSDIVAPCVQQIFLFWITPQLVLNLRSKKAIHIQREQPSLYQQLHLFNSHTFILCFILFLLSVLHKHFLLIINSTSIAL